MAALTRNGIRAAKSTFGKRWFSAGGDVGVFWDLNKCGVQEHHCSEELDPFRIAPNIVQALRISGFSGRICIHAYGNTRSFSQRSFLQALLATGVDLHHVSGGRNELNNHLLLELLLWAKENSPPSHVLLISGDNSLSSVMHKLRMRGFGILLAYPEEAIPSDLLGATEKAWAWESMMKGIAGPCSSSHLGSCKSTEHGSTKHQVLSSQDPHLEIDAKSISWCPDTIKKSHKIPEIVVKQVLDIIRSRSSGFTLGAFRRQLGKSNVVLDKDFYGHKDLFSFLMAVPKLKASLVWTTDRNRTYLFTEDLSGKSTADLRGGKGRPLDSVDGDKNVISEEEEARKKKRKKSSQHSRLEETQHLEMKPVTNMEYGKESIVAKVAGACRRALSKIIVGFKSAAPDIALSTRKPNTENLQHNGHGRHNDSRAAQIIAKDARPSPSQEEEMFETNKQNTDVPKVIEAGSGCLPLHGEECVVEQNREPENFQDQKRQWLRPNLSLQEEPCDVHIEKPLSCFLSEGREYDLIQEVLKSTCLTEQLCKEIAHRLFSVEQSFEQTKATSMDELVKALTNVLHLCGATLKQEELNYLAELVSQRIRGRAENEAESDTGNAETKTVLGLHEEEEMPPAQQGVVTIRDRLDRMELKSGVFKPAFPKRDGDKKALRLASQGVDIVRDLVGMMMEGKSGMFMGSIKPAFLKRYGYELDNKALGHGTLTSLIRSLKELTIIEEGRGELLVLFNATTDEKVAEEGVKAIAAQC